MNFVRNPNWWGSEVIQLLIYSRPQALIQSDFAFDKEKKLGPLTIPEKYIQQDMRNALLESEKYSLRKQKDTLFI